MSFAPGKYAARVKNSHVSKDKNGNPLISLELEVEEFGSKQIFWKNLSFAGGAKKISLIALGICGFHGDAMKDLVGIEHFQPVDVEVVLDMLDDGKGGTKLGIKYINDPDMVTKSMTPDDAAKEFNIDLGGEMKALGIHRRICGLPRSDKEIPFEA